MIGMVSPHPHQIRYYAQAALNGFDTLDLFHAAANAKDEIAALLAYLDSFADYAVPIFGSTGVEPWVRLESQIDHSNIDNLPHLEGARA